MSAGNTPKKGMGSIIRFLIAIAVGFWLGFSAVGTLEAATGEFPFEEALLIVFLVFAFFAAVYLQVILHEGGHLLFGLLTGYKFSSFRIGNCIWMKQGGKIRLRRFGMPGTAGQCLMRPPELVDGKMPVMLYNFGGAIVNAVMAAIGIVLYFVLEPLQPLLATFFAFFGGMGALFAFNNGIPMQINGVDNDGRNALSLRKSPEAMYAMWLQLKVSEMLTEGYSLKDMPEEWFVVPPIEEMGNTLIAFRGVTACNRLMSEHCFADAEVLLRRYLDGSKDLNPLYRALLTCDLLYCELIGQNRYEERMRLVDEQQTRMMKALKKTGSVMRTEYAYALLASGDVKKAEKLRAEFDKLSKNYAYPTDLAEECALMDLALAKRVERTTRPTQTAVEIAPSETEENFGNEGGRVETKTENVDEISAPKDEN